MSFYRTDGARALGKGLLAPAGSIIDAELAARVAGYKRTIAGRYKAISPSEVKYLPRGPILVSPKIDGQFWCLVADGDELVLVAPNGKVISGDVPLINEAKKTLLPRIHGRVIMAGELFALRKGGRPRVGDLGSALGGGEQAEVVRLGFFAFDLMEGGDAAAGEASPEYSDRLATLQRLLDGGQRVRAIKTEEVEGHEEVERLFGEWVEGGKGEGLVLRSQDGRIYKLKPIFTLDAVVIGFTEKAEEKEHVRSMLLAVMRENGQYQVIGSCGNMGSDAHRAEVYQLLSPTVTDSKYRFASSTGALYRFVEPTLVVEVKMTDLVVEDSSARPVRRMVLDFDASNGWTSVQLKAGVSLIHPIFNRRRDDKEVNSTDIRAAQILERVEIDELDQAVQRIERPASTILRREVYAKTTRGATAVRKLLLWKTNKEQIDGAFPAYVVHWTDYSPARKDPLKKEVRLAPDEAAATAIAEGMLEAGVKKGWEKQE